MFSFLPRKIWYCSIEILVSWLLSCVYFVLLSNIERAQTNAKCVHNANVLLQCTSFRIQGLLNTSISSFTLNILFPLMLLCVMHLMLNVSCSQVLLSAQSLIKRKHFILTSLGHSNPPSHKYGRPSGWQTFKNTNTKVKKGQQLNLLVSLIWQ